MPQTALVSGGNSGLGFQIALALARQNFHVFIACRSMPKADRAVARLRQRSGNLKVEALPLDLASLDSVRACADRFLARDLPLHVLVANAGIFHGRGQTEEGFEKIFGTNYLGHFLLVQRLRDRLADSARILAIASDVAYWPRRFDWDRCTAPTAPNFIASYGLSKLGLLLWVRELQRSDAGVRVMALHPGFVRSNITIGHRLAGLLRIGVSPVDAARSAVGLLNDPGANGGFFDRHGRSLPWPPLAEDPQLATELWQRSQVWTGSAAVQTRSLAGATRQTRPIETTWVDRFSEREICGPYRLEFDTRELTEIARSIRTEVLPKPPTRRMLRQCLQFVTSGRLGSLLLLAIQWWKGEFYMERHLDSAAVQAIARDSQLLEQLRARLGDDLTLWRSEIWVNYPARQAVPFWHRDVYPKLLSGGGKSLNAYIALSDVTAKNGFEYVPDDRLNANNHAVKISDPFSGNHLLTIDRDLEAEAKPIVLKAGEFVLFTERLAHRSIRNSSGRVRLSIVLRVSQTNVVASGYTSAAQGGSIALERC